MRLSMYLLLIALSLIGSQCANPHKLVVIDNPSDVEITVSFNESESITIAPNTAVETVIAFGKSTVQVDGVQVGEIDLDSDLDYLINPILKKYVIWEMPFFATQRAKDKYRSDYGEPTSTIEGIEVEGNLSIIENQLQISKNWSIGVDQTIPESFKNPTKKEWVIVKKIYRYDHFLALAEMMNSDFFVADDL